MKNMKYVGSHETTKGATMKNSFEIQNATADFSDYYSKTVFLPIRSPKWKQSIF